MRVPVCAYSQHTSSKPLSLWFESSNIVSLCVFNLHFSYKWLWTSFYVSKPFLFPFLYAVCSDLLSIFFPTNLWELIFRNLGQWLICFEHFLIYGVLTVFIILEQHQANKNSSKCSTQLFLTAVESKWLIHRILPEYFAVYSLQIQTFH